MRLLNFTTIKLLIFLTLGILFSSNFNIGWKPILIISILLILILFGVYRYFEKNYTKSHLFGIIAFITTFFIGVLTQTFHQKRNHLNHYSKFNTIEDVSLEFKIHKRLNTGDYYDRYEIDILNINQHKSSGRVLLNINIDSVHEVLNIDDVFACKTTLRSINEPLNPHQFNYKKYLNRNHIYHQLYLKPDELFKVSNTTNTIYGFADSIRKKVISSLKEYHFNTDELAVINALLLGQRQDISDEVYNNYISAGAIHILAVSGLHIGIILLLLNFLLKPLENIKKGEFVKLLLILLFLWGFAIIAGLSASVVRSVTMFSFIAYAMHFKRATNVFNILAISMFFLLLFRPSFLFDVGFQLSYVAVFAIVWIQPMLYKLWNPKLKMVDYLWQLLTVTLTAQIGVLPISLYYFHQFPGLFFISNLIIIPFLGIILGLGILVIILALTNILPQFVANIYGSIIRFMNNFVGWIANQEEFLFRDISFNWKQLITGYLLIICLVLLLKKVNAQRVTSFLIAVLIFQGVYIYDRYETGSIQRFIVFQDSNNTLLALHNGHKIVVSKTNDVNNRIITDYKIGNQINAIEFDSIKSLYSIKNKTLLVVDSLGIYQIKNLYPDYILLTNSTKLNLNRLIDSLQPQLIIADGSNYKSYIEKWKATCLKQKLPFYATSEKGAFIIDIE